MAKRKDSQNVKLNAAKQAKNDEFYTQMPDIAREVSRYTSQLKGKVILCNCDDPYESNFFKYFAMQFNFLGLKKLIASCYAGSPFANTELSLFDNELPENKTTRVPYKIEIAEVEDCGGDGVINSADVENLLRNKKNVLTRLKVDGDFRSSECIALMQQCDVVITNPPFSLFREYVGQLMEYKKQFLVIGNKNAITYREIFSFIKANRLWLGCTSPQEFILPDGTTSKQVQGLCRWFTNLDTPKRHEELTLYKHYTPAEYPTYENYDAIDVSKVSEIPMDYDGVMGVPITFIDKYNPEQFEIVGHMHSGDYSPAVEALRTNP
ncbi:MAG: adenine-specific methyltransferase EcoRI family protein, partial [Planctomycetaceae bacterium]|nr:adenine-specific methyltransferase EcoRI family protein [Planctomycetaceae bacterium]